MCADNNNVAMIFKIKQKTCTKLIIVLSQNHNIHGCQLHSRTIGDNQKILTIYDDEEKKSAN